MKTQKKCGQKAMRILALLLVVIMMVTANGFTTLAETVSENRGVSEGQSGSRSDSDSKAPVNGDAKANAGEAKAAESGSKSEGAVQDGSESEGVVQDGTESKEAAQEGSEAEEAAESETDPEETAETDMRTEAVAETGTETNVESESLDTAQAAAPSNPVHHCTKQNDGTDYTDWSYIYFGSYPQSEVTDASTISAIESAIASSGVSGDAGVDVWVGGIKYRRISKSDTNYDEYFGSNTYRYFKWERIKWKVLSNNGATLFVVADKGLDCKNYNETYTDVTWETCTLRSWLGNQFYNAAFSAAEQSAIVTQSVVNNDNPDYSTEGGNNTNDKVYLLSIEEVTKPAYGFCEDYSTYSASRWVQPSAYSHARGAYTYNSSSTGGNDNCWWWVRSPGRYSSSAPYVPYSGYVRRYGNSVDYDNDAVVPALHITLSSGIWSMSDDGTSGVGGDTRKVATPVASTYGGTFSMSQKVKLSTSTSGADIYYTIDGTEPSETNGTKYNGKELTISDAVTLKAIAIKDGMDDSDVMTEIYNFTVTKQMQVQQMPSLTLGNNQGGEVKDKKVTQFFPGDFSLKTATIPVTASASYDADGGYKFKVAIGIGKTDWLDDNSEWNKYKKQIKELEKARSNMDKLLSKYQDGTTKAPVISTSKFSVKPKVSVMGYYEMKVDKNGNIVSQSGMIQGDAKWKASKDWQFLTPIGPMYLSLSGGAGITGKLGVKYVMPDGTIRNGRWKLDGSLTVQPTISLEGGYGISKVATIGAKGEANVPIQVIPASKGTFEASASVHVYVIFVYDNEFKLAKTSVPLWDTTTKKENLANALLSETGYELQSGTGWKPLDRSFAEETSTWNGALACAGESQDTDEIEKLDASGASNTGTKTSSASLLQSSVMPSTIPLLAKVGDYQVMVFQQNDESRSTLNSSKLMYSVLKDGSWSNPEPLWDNGTLDAYADLQVVDDELYVVWQKENSEISANESDSAAVFAEMAEKSEICISHFNQSTTEFETPQYITSDAKADMMPKLAVNGDVLTAIWVSNTENDLFGEKGTNQIYKASLSEDNSFAEPELLYETQLGIDEIKPVLVQDSVSVAAVLSDGSLLDAESPNHLIVLSDSAQVRQLTDGSSMVSGLEFGDGYLTYIEEGTIKAYDFATSTTQILSAEDSAVTGNASIFSRNGKTAILYSSAQDSGSKVYASIKNEGVFGEPIVLYETEEQIRHMDGVLNDDGTWNLLLNQGKAAEDSEVHSIVYVGTMPVEQISLDMVMVDDVADENGNITINYAVTNTNEQTVDRLHLQIKDQDGNVLKEDTIPVDIESGGSLYNTYSVNSGELSDAQKTTISIYADDQSETENTEEIVLNPTDLSVSAIMVTDGEDVTIVSSVSNNSSVPADAKVTVYGDVEQTNKVAEQDFGILMPNEVQSFTFMLNKDALSETEKGACYVPVVVTSSVEDFNEDNNVDIEVLYEESSKETEGEGKESGNENEDVTDKQQQDSEGTGKSEVKQESSEGSGGKGLQGAKEEASAGIKITKLSINLPSKKLAAGKTVRLTANITPESATDKSVTWKVSDSKYASITRTGKLTLKAAGAGKTVTVTAAATDGSGVTASCKVKIMKDAVTKVQIKQGSKTLKNGKTITGKAGSSVKLKAAVTVSNKKGKVKSGYKANKTVTWTSNNTKYATVNQSGKVKLLKAGKGKTVTITAAATDGSGKKAKVKIRIK